MTRELPFNFRAAANEHGSAVLNLSHDFPQPGDTVKVWVNLADVLPKPKGRFEISIREFDNGKTVLASEFTCTVRESRCPEVLLKLPPDMELGYYTLVLHGPKKQEIASEPLIVVDSISQARFDLGDAALQCMLDAAEAKREGNLHRVILLLEKASGLYDRAESPQCAGLALVNAAEVAKTVGVSQERFEYLGWSAVKFLLVAGDTEGAADVTRKLVSSATSIHESVSHYVASARAALETDSVATDIERRQRIILDVAARSLPPPSEDGILEKILATMRKSQTNQYITRTEELIYLATKEIAVYAPGVLLNGPRGPIIHCTTFVSMFRELSHSFAASAMAR